MKELLDKLSGLFTTIAFVLFIVVVIVMYPFMLFVDMIFSINQGKENV